MLLLLGVAPPSSSSAVNSHPDCAAHPLRRFPPHIPALLAPTAQRLLGGVNVMQRAVAGRHSALDAFQAHCLLAVTLLDNCCALPVYPPGSSRRAEPAAYITHGGCTLLSLDGLQLFPRVPSGASGVIAIVLNLGAPQFGIQH